MVDYCFWMYFDVVALEVMNGSICSFSIWLFFWGEEDLEAEPRSILALSDCCP